ncbi:MAG TPA: sigma-70 family RNA polymerase sigma factor [Actinobacteria bacterium]|nr:sigma-70 family RNA polymerase sigma factor [Actinomycetota bacterium]
MTEKHKLARLVKRVQKGDSNAFGRIYDRYYDSVYAYVLHQVGSRTDAEDITAGVFLDALERIESFSWRGAGFEAWLFRIARHDVLDYFRWRRRRQHDVALDGTKHPLAAARVADPAEAACEKSYLLQAISNLSEEQQQVILLKLVADLSNQQIGEVLSKSEGAVKALRYRALLSLKQVLDGWEGRVDDV